jgi:hypothetical protein
LDFDTSKSNDKDRQLSAEGGGSPDSSTASAGRPGRGFDTSRAQHPLPNEGERSEEFRIPAGARKAALVHLALEAWRKGQLAPKELGEVRGRDVDEAGLQRALYRSSMGEIEHLLGPVVKGRRVIVEGHLTGTGRTAIERLGAEVEELRLEDEKRYVDMTPAIFVFAALAMAIRYISLGLDDQDLYILAGILFALMYGLRPFFFKMQRPRDE